MPLDVEFFERIARLGREGQSFAVATVVGRRAPVSSHLGDRAIIFADGRMEGFVGGACSHEIVRTQALEVLASGQSRIVSIRPDAGSHRVDRRPRGRADDVCVGGRRGCLHRTTRSRAPSRHRRRDADRSRARARGARPRLPGDPRCGRSRTGRQNHAIQIDAPYPSYSCSTTTDTLSGWNSLAIIVSEEWPVRWHP